MMGVVRAATRRGVLGLWVLTLGSLAAGMARAEDARYGTRDEARALVRRGIDFIASVGLEAALTAFSDHNGAFVDRDLYLVVIDMTGRRLAHGANARLIGRYITETPDATGKAYGRDILDGALAAGTGWVDYVFADPLTGRLLPKSSYFERAGDLVVLCGAYLRR